MISIVNGVLQDENQLTAEVPLTPQEQLALSKAMSTGIVLLRCSVATAEGSPSFEITGIEASFYDPWGHDDSAGAIYASHDFTTPVTVSAGSQEMPMVDLTGFKELGVFPNLIRLKISTTATNLSGTDGDWFWGAHIGIVMSSPS